MRTLIESEGSARTSIMFKKAEREIKVKNRKGREWI
jgi:hypothetical protein